MAAASPTPFAMSRDAFPRRQPSRSFLRDQASRPMLKRGPPLQPAHQRGHGALSHDWKLSMGDSSDDEAPVPPMVLSAEAKRILGDEASDIGGSSPSSKHTTTKDGVPDNAKTSGERPVPSPFDSLSRGRVASPSSQLSGALRVVRLSPAIVGAGVPRRTASTSVTQESPAARRSQDLITPAPRPRSAQAIASKTSDGSPPIDSAEPSTAKADLAANDHGMEPRTVVREGENALHKTVAQIGNLSITGAKEEDTGIQGSLRVKRLGKVSGRFLSGPAKRGMKRRQSEEDQSPVPGSAFGSGGALNVAMERNEGSERRNTRPQSLGTTSPKRQIYTDIILEPAHSHGHRENNGKHIEGMKEENPNDKMSIAILEDKPEFRARSPPRVKTSQEDPVPPVFKVPPLPPLVSRFDQENEPPPTFRRNKANGLALSEKPQGFSVLPDRKSLAKTPGTVSPPRPALAPRSQNTPMRAPPPPPPKMTVLETATAPAGSASASQARKKRNYISVNGKLFTRMDCIGRGGSSKVYRVMAENFKVFALKRVTLENQDDLAIRGFKGEIDLLKRLENVDRVVRLFDWELNHERQTLSVLMEMGESDLSRVLTQKLNADDATLDITFTRYFWKEMLECVEAVHKHDIVHSDLKPANFLLLQGKLKLIDFGISDAIQDDTVNVHRAQTVGTPNYMSPEALVDSTAISGLPASVGKMMKLGKPSDVWSLGCILYQMVYGKPPFAHIADPYIRVRAIPDPRNVIAFSDLGVGGVSLPNGLLKTLRRCLNRDASQRPSLEELLGPSDPFLNPEVALMGTVPVSQELLGRIQLNIVRHIREKGLPDENELATWPARFFASIKAAVEEGRA